MTAGIAIKVDNDEDRDGWTQVLAAFEITEVYELPGLGVPMSSSIMVEHLGQVENFRRAPVVVIQPVNGDFFKGDQSLLEFNHPDEAIYAFGGTITRLTLGDLHGLTHKSTVFIPIGDLFPSQAGALVLWDRFIKANF